MFEASEALQKSEGTNRIKKNVVSLVFMKFCIRNNLNKLGWLSNILVPESDMYCLKQD